MFRAYYVHKMEQKPLKNKHLLLKGYVKRPPSQRNIKKKHLPFSGRKIRQI